MEEADKKGCTYVIATDPDADRFICAQKENTQVLFFNDIHDSGMFSKEMKLEPFLPISCVNRILIVKAV